LAIFGQKRAPKIIVAGLLLLFTHLAKTICNFGLYYKNVKATFMKEKLDDKAIKELEKLEFKAQMALLHDQQLLQMAKQEPRYFMGDMSHFGRLKGPFPVETYSQILKSLQFMLDRMVSSRLAVMTGFSEHVRNEVVLPLNKWRKEYLKAVIFNFYILSGALRSREPLPQHMPDVKAARAELRAQFQHSSAIKGQKFSKHHQ
jgi:hypothetical protein